VNATAGGNGRSAELLTFPCRFDIKAMGRASARFEALVHAIVSRHVAPEDLLAVQSRHSRQGNYISLTCVIRARSRDQLDSIYRDLGECGEVLMAL